MPDPVHGKNVTLSLFIDPDFVPALCATDVIFNRSVEWVEKTGPNSGRSREVVPRIEEWNASVSGLTKIQNTADALSVFFLMQPDQIILQYDVKLTYEDDEGDFVDITGEAFLGGIDLGSAFIDFTNCVIEIKWTGDFTITVIAA